MIGQLPGVTGVQYTATVGADAYRSPLVPPVDTNGLSVDAASLGLPAVAGTSVAQGSYLNAATARQPVAVLGAEAAQLMGIDRIWPGERIWVGGQWFYLAGILRPATLASQIDASILVGFRAARTYLGFDGPPSELYVRSRQHPGRHHQGRQSARRAGQSGEPERGRRLSAVASADRAGGRRRRLRHLVSWPGCRRVAGRSRRRGQHHGHLGSRTASGDRAAAGAGRDQGPDPHPVPGRGHPARPGRWRRRGQRRGRCHRHLWPRPRLADRHSARGVAGGLAAALLIGALAGLLPAIRAARLSPTQALWTL